MKENEKLSLVDLGKRLLEASRNGQAEVVKDLMQNGAPFTTDWLGTSPLHLAAQHGHTQTAEQLLRSGVSRDARTKVDRTPLHMAAQNGHLSIVELLISYGACVNNKDMLNMTPLHWACEYNHSEIIKALLQAGAQTDIINKFGKSPMDIAGKKCGEENIALLNAGQENSSTRETKSPECIKRPVERASISVNSVKKRQRTKKFPMTAGSWTGSDAPPGNSTKGRKRSAGAPSVLNVSAVSNGRRLSAPAQYQNLGSPSLRSPTENSIASLVSAAELVKSKAEAQGSDAAATTAQDSSVLDTLATLATATMSHNTGPTPSSTMQHVTAISAGRGINVTPLSIPGSNVTHASSVLTTPLTPSNLFPLHSPLAALSALTSLSAPSQTSPLPNIAMSPLTFQMPVSLTQQQLLMSGTQLVSSLAQQGSVPSASVISSADNSHSSSSAENANLLASIAPTHTLLPHQFLAYAGNANQGHFLTQIPQGHIKVDQDNTKTQESTESKPEESSSQPGQEMYVTVQVPSNMHSIPSQAIGDHSFTLQPVLVQPGATAQEQALMTAQTTAAQHEKPHEQPNPATTSQVVQLQIPAGLVSQPPGQLIQIPGIAEPLTIAQLQQIMAGPVPQVIISPQKIQLTPNSPLHQVTTQQSQTQATSTILPQQISQQLLQQSIPQGIIHHNIIPQGGDFQQQTLPPSIPSQVFLQVQEDFRKLIEQQKIDEERQRKELEEKLLTLEQHSKKYRSELEIAQKAAETYRDQLQTESRERARLLELYESPKKGSENPTTTTVDSTPK